MAVECGLYWFKNCWKLLCFYNVLRIIRTSHGTCSLINWRTVPVGTTCWNRKGTVTDQWFTCGHEVVWQCKNAFNTSIMWNNEHQKVLLEDKKPVMKLKCIMDYSCKMGAADWTDMADGRRCTHMTLIGFSRPAVLSTSSRKWLCVRYWGMAPCIHLPPIDESFHSLFFSRSPLMTFIWNSRSNIPLSLCIR